MYQSMRSLKGGLAAALLLFSANSQAHTIGNACRMIPPNTLFFSTTAGTGITETQFNKVLDDVKTVYTPIFKKHGANFVIERKWRDGTVNAYAMQFGKDWQISMFGGLARHPEVTADAFAIVACHEVGHHLGGQPRYDGGTDWASVEGQSDYFATLKCFRKVLEATGGKWMTEDEVATLLTANPTAEAKCKEGQSTTPESLAICVRGAVGGEAAARLLATLGREPMPKFETPDKSKVSDVDEAHPAAQCRLDTYFAGAVCPVAHTEDVDAKDVRKGTCNLPPAAPVPAPVPAPASFASVDLGIRPACWFVEKDYTATPPPRDDNNWPWPNNE